MEKQIEFWLDKIAKQVVEREKNLKRGIKVLRTESGLGASGFPHIGSFGDVVRSYGVALALKDLGFKSEFIAYSDDRDGLRRVPLSLPDWLEDYIGMPVTDIPDPFKCHDSYGEHMSSLLIEAIEKAGIEFTFQSGTKNYRKGILDKQIEAILINADRVGEIVKELVGQEKFVEMLPYFPVCENCGRLYTTRAHKLISEEHKVLYVCDQEFVGKNLNNWKEIVVRGCGYKGEASYVKGNGKLSWKGEFAARWDALKIVFEAHGKDILDSVRVNDVICREILKFEPPVHLMYEMFLDKSGKKLSKSFGNVFTPQVWFNYGSVQSLLLLMFKRFVGTRELDVTDIPRYMDELDKLERIHFGLEKIKNKRDLVNAKRLFEYVHFLRPPKTLSLHVPYRTIVEVAKILPEKNQVEFALGKLKEFGYFKKVSKSRRKCIEERLEFAKNWQKDFGRPEIELIEVSEKEKNAIRELAESIIEEKDGEKLQTRIFEIAKENGIKPPDFFRLLYQVILKSNKGPRLGPYIIERGKEEVISKLKEVL
ncbi:MAG: lysine--tRNA ligase [Candidatus Aenigmarchaeota archaeon]|nr:lysine--tRNA ligase [Candidatus Aenigmarchaeota archaeon]